MAEKMARGTGEVVRVDGNLRENIDDLERKFREFISAVLFREYGACWWDRCVPAGIKEKVEARMATGKGPGSYSRLGEDDEGTIRIELCDAIDYRPLILGKNNWPHFRPLIQDRDIFEVATLFFCDFLNSTRNDRNIDKLSLGRGASSVAWLLEALAEANAIFLSRPVAEITGGSKEPGPFSEEPSTSVTDEEKRTAEIEGNRIREESEYSNGRGGRIYSGSRVERQNTRIGNSEYEEPRGKKTPLPKDRTAIEERLLLRIYNSGFPEIDSTESLLAFDERAFSEARGVGSESIKALRAFKLRCASAGGDKLVEESRTGAGGNYLGTPIDELSLLAKERILINRIRASGFSSVETAEQLLEISSTDLLGIRGIGESYLKLLIDFQSRLRDKFSLEIPSSSVGLAKEKILAEILLEEFTLNHSCLSPEEKKAISAGDRVNRRFLTANEVVGIGGGKASGIRGIGGVKGRVLQCLATKISEDLLAQAGDDPTGIPPVRLVVGTKERTFSIQDLEEFLIEDLDACLGGIEDRVGRIVTARLGYGVERRTLEELGVELGCTRERIRQLEEGFYRALPHHLRVPSPTIWANLKDHVESELSVLMPALCEKFIRPQEFVRCMELCSGVDRKSIHELQFRGKPDTGVLDELYCREASPYSFEDIFRELLAQSYRPVQAKHYISDMVAMGRLRQVDGKFRPAQLAKQPALVHALLDEPMGMHWKDLQMKVKRLGLSSAALSTDRLEVTGTEEGIYLCGRGVYRHVRFISLSYEDGLNLVKLVKEKLKKTGKAWGSLQSLLHMVDPAVDYFELRHYARNYGEVHGLHFAGRSGADTVSLERDFELITTDNFVLDFVDKSYSGTRVADVASLLKSKSVRMARLVLGRLAHSGKIVHKTTGVYVTTGKAFVGLDTDALRTAVQEAMSAFGGPVTLREIRGAVNEELDTRFTTQFYQLFMRENGITGEVAADRDLNSEPQISSETPMESREPVRLRGFRTVH